MNEKRFQMRKKLIITLGILLTLVLAGWGWLHLKTYKPTEQARQVWQADAIKKIWLCHLSS